MKMECKICNDTFEKRTNNNLYCSEKCRIEANRIRQNKYRSNKKVKLSNTSREKKRFEGNKEKVLHKQRLKNKLTANTASKNYARWSNTDTDRLIYLHKKVTSHMDIAIELHRTLDSIQNRLKLLHNRGDIKLHYGNKHAN